MPRGDNLIRVSASTARARQDLELLERASREELAAAVRRLGRYATRAMKDAAPEDTADLVDAIEGDDRTQGEPIRYQVRVAGWRGHQGAEFDPTFTDSSVTRLGHRAATIRPVQARTLKVHIEGHRNPHAAIYRQSVRGSRPVTDWSDAAVTAVQGRAVLEARILGRRIDARRA